MMDVFESVLKRHDYLIKKENTGSTIYKVGNERSPVKSFYYYSTFLFIMGLILIFTVSLFFGVILLFIAIPMFMKSSDFNNMEKRDTSETIEISPLNITVYRKKERIDLLIEKIKQINYFIEKDKDISIGTLQVIMEDEEAYSMIKIFGTNKSYVEDDTEIIATKFTEIINK